MKLKIVCLILLVLLAASGSNCKKKIAKYDFDMYGVWYAGDDFCGTVLVIERSGQGKLFSLGGTFCSETTNVKGTVKYKKDILYIGKKKYTMFDEPKLVTGNDSIDAPDENDFSNEKTKPRKVLAKMKLQAKGLMSFDETYTFCKYVDY